MLDPGAVALGFWVWTDGGFYYGIPSGNYLGWLLSGAIAATIALAVGRWREPPLPALLDSAIIAVAFWTGVAVFVLLPGAGLARGRVVCVPDPSPLATLPGQTLPSRSRRV